MDQRLALLVTIKDVLNFTKPNRHSNATVVYSKCMQENRIYEVKTKKTRKRHTNIQNLAQSMTSLAEVWIGLLQADSKIKKNTED